LATAQVHGLVAQARSNRFKLINAIQDVNRQIFQLQANVDALDKAIPIRKNALDDFNRYTEVMKTKGATTQQELDLKLQNYLVAKARIAPSAARSAVDPPADCVPAGRNGRFLCCSRQNPVLDAGDRVRVDR
jgi:hypothetical protein